MRTSLSSAQPDSMNSKRQNYRVKREQEQREQIKESLLPTCSTCAAAVCPFHISQSSPAVSTSSTLESSEARGSEPQEKEYEGLLHTPVENCFFWFGFWFLLLCFGLGLFVVFLFIFSKQLLAIICSLMEIGFSKPSFISISKRQTLLAKAAASFTLDKKCLHLQDKNTTFLHLHKTHQF